MSEVMLHGALNAPIDPGDVMGVTQLKNRARQASELIYAQQKRITELEGSIEEILRIKQGRNYGGRTIRVICEQALSEGGADE